MIVAKIEFGKITPLDQSIPTQSDQFGVRNIMFADSVYSVDVKVSLSIDSTIPMDGAFLRVDTLAENVSVPCEGGVAIHAHVQKEISLAFAATWTTGGGGALPIMNMLSVQKVPVTFVRFLDIVPTQVKANVTMALTHTFKFTSTSHNRIMTLRAFVLDKATGNVVGNTKSKSPLDFFVRTIRARSNLKRKLNHKTADSKLSTFHHIGNGYIETLEKMGIRSVRDLAGMRHRTKDIWSRLYVSRGQLSLWIFENIVDQCCEIVNDGNEDERSKRPKTQSSVDTLRRLDEIEAQHLAQIDMIRQMKEQIAELIDLNCMTAKSLEE